MQNKLQELTDRLYKDGLSKGQQEANLLLEKAKKEAEQMLAKAKEEADQLLIQAQETAAEAKKNVESEVRLATRQTMTTVKQTIEELVTTKVIAAPTKAVMTDAEFVKSLIKTAVERFSPQSANAQLSVILPEAMQQSLQAFVDEQIRKQLSGGLEVQFDKTIKSGFKIGAKADGFHISLTDKDFESLFSEYLRPNIRALLFGE